MIDKSASVLPTLRLLNAQYYDPKLGMFLQPNWWAVTQAWGGVKPRGLLRCRGCFLSKMWVFQPGDQPSVRNECAPYETEVVH